MYFKEAEGLESNLKQKYIYIYMNLRIREGGNYHMIYMQGNTTHDTILLQNHFRFFHNQLRAHYLHTPEYHWGNSWASFGVGSWASLEHCCELV